MPTVPTTPNVLPISETFISLQGEGVLTGVPSWFCRVSGCNLRCTWCDTPYASWQPELAGGAPRSIDSLLEEARASAVHHAVLTGGEPMLFPAVAMLAERLHGQRMHITIETAGTIFRDLPCDLLSLSPKLANSTPARNDPRDPTGQWHDRHEARRSDLGALQALIDRYASRQFKFVVSSPVDLQEIESLLGKLRGWQASEVHLMPEGTAVPPAGSLEWLVRVCVERGFRLCSRQHLQWFGHRRGT